MSIKAGTSSTATVDAAGRAAVQLGPVPNGKRWALKRVTVTCTGAATPIASVYEGHEEASNLLDATYTGSQDASDFPAGTDLMAGEFLTVVWTGATPGAIATANLRAEQSELW